MSFDAFRVQRIGDPVFCTHGCGNCQPFCPPGEILTGQANFYVENKPVAIVGSVCSNCCNGCNCCPCPNYVLTGFYFNFFYYNRGVVRKMDLVSNGYFLAGALRTFIGGVSV